MQKKGYTLRQILVKTKPNHRKFIRPAGAENRLSHWSSTVLTVFCLVGLMAASGAPPAKSDVELKVGVVQRFGEEPTDEMTLAATTGDRLTVRFDAGDRQQTLQASNVKLQVTMQPLPDPVLEERLVLGSYRSFETAEYSANQWKAKGIEVEVAQPERWQVWAKRDVYKTPLVRRWLLQSLKTQGNQAAFLNTQIVQQVPKTSLVVNGVKYSRDKMEITAAKNLIQVQKGKNAKNSFLYAGPLQLQPNAYGTYTLVNQVPLETYLRGVVPHELDAGAPYAAAEAQAIIARTYALRNLRRFTVDGYELCADTHCQVYKGLTGTVPTTDKAIAATKGKVLTYQNELVDALYSSTTGGVTAHFSDVWNGSDRPYLQIVVDSANSVWNLSQFPLASEQNIRRFINLKQGFNETGANWFRWSRSSTIVQITQDLKRYLQRTKTPFVPFNTIKQLRVVERSPSGRILKLAVQTDTGVIEIHKDDVRSAFMAPRSTLFYLQPIYGADKSVKGYAFVGGGLGHAVGMSQTGAFNLAKVGWSSQQILNFYYPGAQIQPLNESITFWQDRSQQTQPNS
ncbi:SpoIID/LytB domain-containing protein [Funiculus sociatus GB2-A5]|uniref:SpoIID/LytB domain-containing protein n=1 Tax=Funiculus sociatus GB2-A5 TaxID=2933946 RepID=A0ABV0JXF7_9CYAN|nr:MULTISPECIES: SpoIID/LytB domain-containing protein [unclassified Trichocoleus]MBD1904154.1 SpoIID/LytB domain-containing protein [Trichocoleus sp. FACHB-832]MBD2063751.1 SpoIID/LytB domain-containing protein [Trichocoleus sp. FACHB-6]